MKTNQYTEIFLIFVFIFVYNTLHYNTINPKVWWFTEVEVGQVWTYTESNPNPFQSLHRDTIWIADVKEDVCKGRRVSWYGVRRIYDQVEVHHKDDILRKYTLK